MINLASDEYNNFENSVLVLLGSGASLDELRERLGVIWDWMQL